MDSSFENIQGFFFIGVAGTGMSGLAQFLSGTGKKVSGSDRYFNLGDSNKIKKQLEDAGITCYPQDGSGPLQNIDVVIISTAIEEDNIELQKARLLGIEVWKRSELLSKISLSKKTIAVGGTSGKSTVTAMIFEILQFAGLNPSFIGGAGLIRLQEQGLIGNAFVGNGEWLVTEADESDGSIVNYHPEIGVLLNIDKDHKEIDELKEIFRIFKENSNYFIVNASHAPTLPFSQKYAQNFSATHAHAGYVATGFEQNGFSMRFSINGIAFNLEGIGKHNMENALAATATAALVGVGLPISAKALQGYKGIYRRYQILGKKREVWVVDDYAHNPAKVAAAITGMHPIAPSVIAWFQPHGYAPTKFMQQEFVADIANSLRDSDQIWMSEIYYAGGTATKDISSNNLIEGIRALGKQAFFVADRNNFLETARPYLNKPCILLLMGARDPSLEAFASEVLKLL